MTPFVAEVLAVGCWFVDDDKPSGGGMITAGGAGGWTMGKGMQVRMISRTLCPYSEE
jgi:hypothetical protein